MVGLPGGVRASAGACMVPTRAASHLAVRCVRACILPCRPPSDVVAKLREQAQLGKMRAEDICQAHVLTAALDIDLDADAVPLRQLRVLALSEVFRIIWKEAGEDARQKVFEFAETQGPMAGGGEGPGGSRADTKGGDRDAGSGAFDAVAGGDEMGADGTLPLLPLSAVFEEVIPRALSSWKSLIEGLLSGSISWGATRAYFDQKHRGRIEKEVRLMLLIGANPAVGLPREVEEAVRANDATLMAEIRRFQKKGSLYTEKLVHRILDFIEAQESIVWCLENIAGLLRAQEVLACPSLGDGNVLGNASAGGAERGVARASRGTQADGEDEGVDYDAADDLDPSDLFDELPGDGAGGEEAGAPTGSVTGIFASSLESDPSRSELERILADLEQRRQDFSANAASEEWKRVGDWGMPEGGRHLGTTNNRYRGGLIEQSRAHVELLISLSTCPALVQWLLEVRSELSL